MHLPATKTAPPCSAWELAGRWVTVVHRAVCTRSALCITQARRAGLAVLVVGTLHAFVVCVRAGHHSALSEFYIPQWDVALIIYYGLFCYYGMFFWFLVCCFLLRRRSVAVFQGSGQSR